MAALNELDWPMMSWATGFTDRCWKHGPIQGSRSRLSHSYWKKNNRKVFESKFLSLDNSSWVPGKNVDSIYSRLVKRNRCNMNDFQNQPKNGSKSAKMADRTIFGLSRNLKDRPMIVFLSLGKLQLFGIIRLKTNWPCYRRMTFCFSRFYKVVEWCR